MPYTIKSGDTLSALALKHNTTVADLAKANSIADPNKIYAGATLNIPGKATTAAPAVYSATNATNHVNNNIVPTMNNANQSILDQQARTSALNGLPQTTTPTTTKPFTTA